MKLFRHTAYILTAVFSLGAMSCVQENIEEQSVPDLENSFGVYFPTQKTSSDLNELEPTDDNLQSVTFTVKRLKDEGKVIVPLTLNDSEGIFNAPKSVTFEDGQKEVTFDVTFETLALGEKPQKPDGPEKTDEAPDTEDEGYKAVNKAQIGKEYSASFEVTGPEFVLTYGEYPAFMSFSVMVVNWIDLGVKDGGERKYGRWRDNFLTTFLGFDPPMPESVHVSVYEREDRPGYFRIEDAYGAEFFFDWFGKAGESPEDYANIDMHRSIIIDASDPAKVFIPAQKTGLNCDNVFGQYGELSIASLSSKNFSSVTAEEEVYGTYDKATGIIEFPKEGLLACLPGVTGEGSYATSNLEGLFRVVLPGFEPFDYSISLKPGMSTAADGKLPLGYTFGSNVSSAKYSISSGALTEIAAAAEAERISATEPGKDKVEKFERPSGTLEIVLEKSGVYTVVTANFAKKDAASAEEYKDFSYTTFHYIAKDQEMDVLFSGELSATDRNMAEGYTSENSLEFFAYGNGITEAYLYMDLTATVAGMPDDKLVPVLDEMIARGQLKPLDAETIAAINGPGGYGEVLSDLAPGTGYTVLAYVSNGYKWDLFRIAGATEGKYSVLYETGISSQTIAPSSPDAFTGEWDYYAIDRLDPKSSVRKKIGTVNVSLSGNQLLISGLLGKGAEKVKVKDELDVSPLQTSSGIYLGITPKVFASTKDIYPEITVYPVVSYLYSSGGSLVTFPLLPPLSALMGGFLYDDVLVFTDSGLLYQSQITSSKMLGISLSGFGTYFPEDDQYFAEATNQLATYAAYTDIMLLPKGTDPEKVGPGAPETAPDLGSGAAMKADRLRRSGLKVSMEPERVDFVATVRERQETGNGIAAVCRPVAASYTVK